eukprot:c2977_g1_i2.p1 GENE.c2977_g1_i2~~c2977_g1_i2.p1  ORF type:complete len:193 (-),score=58.73 c2977_g1_i2:140-718(-)
MWGVLCVVVWQVFMFPPTPANYQSQIPTELTEQLKQVMFQKMSSFSTPQTDVPQHPHIPIPIPLPTSLQMQHDSLPVFSAHSIQQMRSGGGGARPLTIIDSTASDTKEKAKISFQLGEWAPKATPTPTPTPTPLENSLYDPKVNTAYKPDPQPDAGHDRAWDPENVPDEPERTPVPTPTETPKPKPKKYGTP